MLGYDIETEKVDGEDRIVMPDDKRAAKELLSVLGEGLFLSAITNELRLAKAHERFSSSRLPKTSTKEKSAKNKTVKKASKKKVAKKRKHERATASARMKPLMIMLSV